MKALNPEMTGYARLMAMVEKGGRIDLLSDSSAYGYIYRLQIAEDTAAQYMRWSLGGFTRPATTLVIKCVPLTPEHLVKEGFFVEVNTGYAGFGHNTMQWEQLLEEAAAQQWVWSQSVRDGRHQLCPAVADVFRVDGDAATQFARMIDSHTNAADVLTKSIGVIVMDMVDNAESLKVALERGDDKVGAYVCTTAMIYAMYLEARLRHEDAHTDNVMLQKNDGNTHAIALDFGKFELVPDTDERWQNNVRAIHDMACGSSSSETNRVDLFERLYAGVDSFVVTHYRRDAQKDTGPGNAFVLAVMDKLLQRARPLQCEPLPIEDYVSQKLLPAFPTLSATRRERTINRTFMPMATKRALSPALFPVSSASSASQPRARQRVETVYVDDDSIHRRMRAIVNGAAEDDLELWDTSNVTSFDELFKHRSVPPCIANWDTRNVCSMYEIFLGATFADPFMSLNTWSTRKVDDMTRAFAESNFDGDVSRWDVRKVKKMDEMFYMCPFTGDIDGWQISPDATTNAMFTMGEAVAR